MGGGGGRNHQTAPSLMPVSAHSADCKIIDLHSKIAFSVKSSFYESSICLLVRGAPTNIPAQGPHIPKSGPDKRLLCISILPLQISEPFYTILP